MSLQVHKTLKHELLKYFDNCNIKLKYKWVTIRPLCMTCTRRIWTDSWWLYKINYILYNHHHQWVHIHPLQVIELSSLLSHLFILWFLLSICMNLSDVVLPSCGWSLAISVCILYRPVIYNFLIAPVVVDFCIVFLPIPF